MNIQAIHTKPNPLFVAIAKASGLTLTNIVNRENGSIDQQRATYTTPDGHQFSVVTGGYQWKGKLHISIGFPEHVINEQGGTRYTSQRDFMPYNTPHFDGINVSADKTGEQIAKDINRRFMPKAIELWTACDAFVAKQASYYSTKAVFSEEVTTLLKPFGYDRPSGTVRASVEYMGADYVTLKLDSLNIEQVRKLAAFLATI